MKNILLALFLLSSTFCKEEETPDHSALLLYNKPHTPSFHQSLSFGIGMGITTGICSGIIDRATHDQFWLFTWTTTWVIRKILLEDYLHMKKSRIERNKKFVTELVSSLNAAIAYVIARYGEFK